MEGCLPSFLFNSLYAVQLHVICIKLNFIKGRGRNESSLELQHELNYFIKMAFCLRRGGKFIWIPGACLFTHTFRSAFQHVLDPSASPDALLSINHRLKEEEGSRKEKGERRATNR